MRSLSCNVTLPLYDEIVTVDTLFRFVVASNQRSRFNYKVFLVHTRERERIRAHLRLFSMFVSLIKKIQLESGPF